MSYASQLITAHVLLFLSQTLIHLLRKQTLFAFLLNRRYFSLRWLPDSGMLLTHIQLLWNIILFFFSLFVSWRFDYGRSISNRVYLRGNSKRKASPALSNLVSWDFVAKFHLLSLFITVTPGDYFGSQCSDWFSWYEWHFALRGRHRRRTTKGNGSCSWGTNSILACENSCEFMSTICWTKLLKSRAAWWWCWF